MKPHFQPIAVANQALTKLFGVKLIRSGDPRYVKYDYAPNIKSRKKNRKGAERLRAIMEARAGSYAETLRLFSTFVDDLKNIEAEASDSRSPCWINGFIPALDGVSIYCLLASTNPTVYFEVGSGNSTKFARRAIEDHHLRTRIVSVDPCPRAEIDEICDEVLRGCTARRI